MRLLGGFRGGSSISRGLAALGEQRPAGRPVDAHRGGGAIDRGTVAFVDRGRREVQSTRPAAIDRLVAGRGPHDQRHDQERDDVVHGSR
ncbi:hypothetical protein [Actinomycetospora sp. NBRC 106375]|uniref:hypothetical protein n=1 Tax=Actinomycetospora sp. NBRC 106375 TaxID=3032207 RepID=UPI0025557D12|nr:hypothetical protein [Actinomycetospora sp. NBRC 106375]